VSFDTEKMAALQQRFVASVGDHAERIETLLDGGDLEGVRVLAHGLAGRSGMFGFAELGEMARQVDEADPATLGDRAHELLAALRRVSQPG